MKFLCLVYIFSTSCFERSAAFCLPPVDVVNGKWQLANGDVKRPIYDTFEYILLTCENGDVGNVTCVPGGVWSATPNCLRDDGGQENIMVVTISPTNWPAFSINRATNLIPLLKPDKVERTCSPPQSIAYGTISSGGIFMGETRAVKCLPTYVFCGSESQAEIKTITCTQIGWTPRIPKCVKEASRRYTVIKGNFSYATAFQQCMSIGARLAQVKLQVDIEMISALSADASSQSGCNGYWIGLRSSGKGSPFTWVDDKSDATLTNWAPNQPNYEGCHGEGPTLCVRVAYGGLWDDVFCQETVLEGVICETPALC